MTDHPVDEPLRAAARTIVDYDGPVPGDLGLLVARLKEALAARSPSAAGATPPEAAPSAPSAPPFAAGATPPAAAPSAPGAPGLDVERLQAAMERVAYLQAGRQGRFQERARRVFAEAIAREYNATAPPTDPPTSEHR